MVHSGGIIGHLTVGAVGQFGEFPTPMTMWIGVPQIDFFCAVTHKEVEGGGPPQACHPLVGTNSRVLEIVEGFGKRCGVNFVKIE
jgi:hypothetical protein